MNCIKCDIIILEESVFCPKCATRVKCKKCNKPLLKDAKVCTSCGKKVKKSKKSTQRKGQNSIEIIENKKGRKIKTAFTNKVGKSMTTIFGDILGSKYKSIADAKSNKQLEEVNNFEDFEEIKEDNVTKVLDNVNLKKVFVKQEDVWYLLEKNIKANNLKDSVERIALLFLLMKEGIGEVASKKEVITILKDLNLYNRNVGSYLSKNPNLKIMDNKVLLLNATGKKVAFQYLEDVFNDDIENTWNITEAKKKSTSSKNSESYKMLKMDFSIEERGNIKKFINSKNPNNQNDLVLVAIFLLKEFHEKNNANLDEIYTVIKLGEKTPPNFLRVIINKVKTEDKIRKIDKFTYEITDHGYDYVKNKLPKIK